MWPTTDENFKGIPLFVTSIKMQAKCYIGLSVKTTNIASYMGPTPDKGLPLMSDQTKNIS